MSDVHAGRRHLDTWNDNDADRPHAQATAWVEHGSHVDRRASAHGRDEISALIDTFRSRFPGRSFRLLGDVDGHQSVWRSSRELTPKSAKNRSPSASLERAHGG